ncbi:MAG: hypothetical protein IH984_00045 [Planctomycetes bacterium]|nr:hypothetical protein [Planctomycetota bacterium]
MLATISNRMTTMLVLVFILASTAHAGSVIFVDDDAPPGGDGLSWDTAYRFLQDGLSQALGSALAYGGGGISEIHVAQGTYKPDRDEANPRGTGDREASFNLVNGVSLMGGYAGIGADDPDARDIELYETILSGDLLGNDGPDFQNNDENSYHIIVGSNTDDTTMLDGFTVTAGNADGGDLDEPLGQGGGIFLNSANATIQRITFTANFAKTGGSTIVRQQSNPTFSDCMFIGNKAAAFGGAATVESASSPQFQGCSFDENSALIGGGAMWITSGSTGLANCTFTDNQIPQAPGQARGGAIDADGASITLTITDCTFSRNSAANAGLGGALHIFRGNAIVSNSVFSENTATQDGGAIIIRSSNPSLFIESSLFNNNSSEGGGALACYEGSIVANSVIFDQNVSLNRGGAISNSADLELVHCQLTKNVVEANGQQGGGAIFNSGQLQMLDCILNGNQSQSRGGGIYNNAGGIGFSATNCVFYANIGNDGGGIRALQVVDLRNCILWGNIDNSGNLQQGQLHVPSVDADYNCIEGFTGELGGEGNIADDPLFVDVNGSDGIPGTLDDDFHLSPGSPCIDLGDPLFEPDVDAMDIDGNERLVACRVDIGVDEVPFIGVDCNVNGVSDGCDLLSGFSKDCNFNMIPDECDIANSSSADCNANGIPDQCDVQSTFTFASANLSPLGYQWQQWATLLWPPDAIDDVHLFFNAVAVLGSGGSFVDVDINGEYVGTIFASGANNCPFNPDTDELVVPAEIFNLAGETGIVIINFAPTPFVDPTSCNDQTYINVTVEYPIEASSTDINNNGVPDECEPDFDIKPGSCPNPFNTKSHGMMPAAILGTKNFDTSLINIASLTIARADGVGGSVAPNEGPPGPHSTFDDVGTPFNGELCDCHELDGDGITDLVMHFSTPQMVESLQLSDLPGGSQVELVISGMLTDTTPFTAIDCIELVPAGDLDGDGSVTATDMIMLFSAWGSCRTCIDCSADLDGDCAVNISDLLILLGDWG